MKVLSNYNVNTCAIYSFRMTLLWLIFNMRPMKKMLVMKSKRKKMKMKMMTKKKGTMGHTKVVVHFLYLVRQ